MKIQRILFILVALTPLVVSAALKTVSWTLPADWETGVEYAVDGGRLQIRGGNLIAPAEPGGAPDLPFLTVEIPVTKGTTVSNCSVVAEWRTLTADLPFRPAIIQTPHVVGEDPVATAEDPRYFGAPTYPSQPQDLVTVMMIDGQERLTARVTPYRWNGGDGVLEKAASLTLSFTCDVPKTVRRAMTATAAETYEFVILSPSQYVAHWEKYAEYRRGTHPSLRFLVKNTAEIYTDYADVKGDDALRIHRYLEDMYKNHGTKYVLLGAGCAKGTEAFDRTSMIPLRMTASCNQLYYPSDMYYGCMERKNNVGEVWDPNGDGVYLGSKKSGGGYSSDGYYTIDWTPELTVFRFPARKTATLNGTTYTAQQQIEGFIAKLKRVEDPAFAGNLRTGLSGYKVFAQKSRGDTSNYMTQERTFYDGMQNIFEASHQNPTFDWEYDTRNVHYGQMLAYRPENGGVSHATTTTEAWTFGSQNMEAFLHSSHGAPGGAVPLSAVNFWTTKAIQKISFMCESCLTGKIDEADKITLPEAQLLNPNGGAVVSFNNTREGWGSANAFDSLSSKMKLSILMGFFSATSDSSYTAAQAFAWGQKRYLPTIGGGSGNVGAACYLEVIAFGDPLVKLSAVTDCDDLPADVDGAFYRYATTTNKSLSVSSRSAVSKLTVNGLGGGTFTVSGQDFRAFKGMAVYGGGGKLIWSAPGGVGGAGLAFDQKTDFEISATGTTYFGPIFSNLRNVLVSGKNATLDFDKTGQTRNLASLAFTGAGPNYIRSREGGIFPADFTIPVTGGTLVLQTQNIGGGGAAERPDVPIFALTNATLRISENPNWGTEFFNRAIWMNNSTIYSGYQSFGFGSGNASANGIDIYALGGDNRIDGSTDAEVNGELRAHVADGATLAVNIALVKSSKSGSVRKLGPGTMTLNGALGKNATIAGGIVVAEGRLVAAGSTANAALGTGAVTVEAGGELQLTAIPLTSIKKLTVKKGGKLYLPGAVGAAAYKLVDPLKSSLTVEDGALVYNINDPTTAIDGTATGDGYYMDASGFINWRERDGLWKDDATLENWQTTKGVATGYVDGASVQFTDYGDRSFAVGVSGTLAPSYLNFVNRATSYRFTNATANASVSVGTLNTTGDVTFEPELNVAGNTIVGSGKTTAGTIGTASASVLGGGAFRVTGALNPQTMISRVQLNVTKTYENNTTIGIPGLVTQKGIDCRGWSIHEFQILDANGNAIALPKGTVVSGSSSNCGGSSVGDRSGSFTVSSSVAGRVTGYTGSPNGLQHVFNGSATGNYWGYAKDSSKSSIDGFKPQFSITITFPSPIPMIGGYRIGSADDAKRQIEAWNVKVTEAVSEGVYTVDTQTKSGGAVNAWWPSSTGRYVTTYSGAAGAGELKVAEGAKLYLDGTMNVKPAVSAGATLAVTNRECMTLNKGWMLGGPVTLDVSEADRAGWTPVLTGASLAAGDIAKFFLNDDNASAKIENGTLYVTTQGVRKGPYERTAEGAWNWDDEQWTADGTEFGTNWSAVITRSADDVVVTMNGSTTGTLECAVSAATLRFTNATDSVQSVAIVGNGAVYCGWLDLSGLNGTVVWEPSLNGASVNAGSNTVLLRSGNGGTLNVASNGYVSTVGTFATYNNDEGSIIRFAGDKPRAVTTSQIPAKGVVSFADMTLSGGFQNPSLTYLVEAGDSLTLSGASGNNARCTSSFDIRGGSVTVNPLGSWWYGENGLTHFDLTGGTLTCNATGTTVGDSGSGVVLGYQGEGSNLIELNVAGGRFLVPDAILNVWNPTAVNVSSNGLFRAKGVGSRTDIDGSVTVGETAVFEIGSVGFTAGGMTYNLYGGTVAGYEPGAKVDAPLNLGGGGTLAAAEGTTLNVNATVTGEGTLTIGATNYTGAVRLASVPEAGTIVVAGGELNLGALRPLNKTLGPSAGAVAITLTNTQIKDAQTNPVRIIRATQVPQGGVKVYSIYGHEQSETVAAIDDDGYLTVRTTHGNTVEVTMDATWNNTGDAKTSGVLTGNNFGVCNFSSMTLNFGTNDNIACKNIGNNGKARIKTIKFLKRDSETVPPMPTSVTLSQGGKSITGTVTASADSMVVYMNTWPATAGAYYTKKGGCYVLTFDSEETFDTSENLTISFPSQIGLLVLQPKNSLLQFNNWSPVIQVVGDYIVNTGESPEDEPIDAEQLIMDFVMTADDNMKVVYKTVDRGVTNLLGESATFAFALGETLVRGGGNNNIDNSVNRLVKNFTGTLWEGSPVPNSNLESGNTTNNRFWQMRVPVELGTNRCFVASNVLVKAFITNSTGSSTTGQPLANNKTYAVELAAVNAKLTTTNALCTANTCILGEAKVNDVVTACAAEIKSGYLTLKMYRTGTANLTGSFGGIQGLVFTSAKEPTPEGPTVTEGSGEAVDLGDGSYAVPTTVTKLSGIEPSKVVIKEDGHDITGVFAISSDGNGGVTIALSDDPAAKVVIGGETITLEPVLTAIEKGEHEIESPFVVGGESAAVGVKTIPGLTYKLVRGTAPRGEGAAGTMADETVVQSQKATGVRLKLVDSEKPADRAFYRISVVK